ncbi:MAG: FGGY-family carbohydrate kinase [Armatimonadota bacterium]
MSAGDLLVGVDVGATGIKAGIFDTSGNLVASASRRNAPKPQEGVPSDTPMLIWDGEEMWGKVCDALREVVSAVDDPGRLRGIAVTGFGADGTPMSAHGRQLYPFISWHCTRTLPQRNQVLQEMDPFEIYTITGYHNYTFNTINRLRWLRENAPEALDNAYKWLMVQDFIVYKLCGAFSTECTIASTTMLLDMRTRRLSPRMLKVAQVPETLFPPISESGEVVGRITASSAEATGLPQGMPVATGGHDCEIGMLGSGVWEPSTFVDITGTWEMIIAMLDEFAPTREMFDKGIDYEAHSIPGKYLCQGLMPAGSVVEWVRDGFYSGIPPEDAYALMAEEAGRFRPGAGGVFVLPAFVKSSGPFSADHSLGTILGLTTTTQRGQVARATFESLCYQMRRQMEVIERSTGVRCEKLRVLGGGQKNEFWLQMKADVTGKPVEVLLHPEVTLLGAAILAGVGAGIYSSAEEALRSLPFPVRVFEPQRELYDAYSQAFSLFLKIPEALREFYMTGNPT